MAKKIMTAPALKEAWKVVERQPHVGNFLFWQITANLCKLKLIKLPEDFVALGPVAKVGFRKVYGVTGKVTASRELEMTQTLMKADGPCV